jgi:hypothetical protein
VVNLLSVLSIRNEGGEFVQIPAIKGEKPIKGVDYWTDSDKQEIVDEVISQIDTSGGYYEIGDGLKLVDNVLSVDAATTVEEDNTRPITSAAVYSTVGNIEILLGTI